MGAVLSTYHVATPPFFARFRPAAVAHAPFTVRAGDGRRVVVALVAAAAERYIGVPAGAAVVRRRCRSDTT